jgi:hypothetical protein
VPRERALTALPQHPDEHRSEGPVLLAVDQLGVPERSDAEPSAEDSAVVSALMMVGTQDRVEFLP